MKPLKNEQAHNISDTFQSSVVGNIFFRIFAANPQAYFREKSDIACSNNTNSRSSFKHEKSSKRDFV